VPCVDEYKTAINELIDDKAKRHDHCRRSGRIGAHAS
jgi:hypothetical protein